MPARSVAFTNLRGGCGKSTILFQLAAEFAKASCMRFRPPQPPPPPSIPSACHPPTAARRSLSLSLLQANASTGVLVIDCTAFGDVSRLLLGGRQPHVKAAVGEQHSVGHSSAHLLADLLGPAAAAAAVAPAAPGGAAPVAGARSLAGWAGAGAGAVRRAGDIAQSFGVPVRSLNPEIQLDNLLLIPSGATKQQPCSGLVPADILRLSRRLRVSLDSLPGHWQVFLDTDGDLTFSPATEVALRAAELALIPYAPTESDHDRATEAVARLQRLEAPAAKVGGVIYNMVAPDPRAGAEGWQPFSASLRPHEVTVRRLVDDFSGDWWARARAAPAAFAATAGGGAPAAAALEAEVEQGRRDFYHDSIVLMQARGLVYGLGPCLSVDFGKPGSLAAELGIPFCSMDASRRYATAGGGDGLSLGGSRKLAAVEANVRELRQLLEAAQARLPAASAAAADWEQEAAEGAAVPAAQLQAQQPAVQPAAPQAVQGGERSAPQEARDAPGQTSSLMMALAAVALAAVAPAAAAPVALAAAACAWRSE
eukprot:scaffold5.g954.t1